MHSPVKQSAEHRPFTIDMASPHTHPRRRPIKASASFSSSVHSMSLRKSDTFSSPKSISTDLCDLDNHLHMPRRSPTSPESLEDLLRESSVRRMTNILKDIDQRITGQKTTEPCSASILNDKEVLPLPSFLLDNTAIDCGPMEIDPKEPQQALHDHASDSGLGSSVSSKDGRSSARESVSTSVSTTASAITGSFTAVGGTDDKHTLGEYACRQIHESIIKPILREESLKDFHPLIKDVPRRIGEKNICNLRDLEKTLIFLAPEFSATPASYLSFCERSIQLLYATVDSLSESDQRLPSDRPYTSNYFLDLIEQIRRYAAIMAATRQKEENGEELDEMDYSSKEKLTLSGGLSHDGRPLQLVREKDGKTIPLAEGIDDAYKGLSSTKRALSDDEVDADEATRSMARRRKSDKPGDVMHTCRDCKKEFKRPCDLTKHEKTHSRPWKCTHEKCKYYDLGWPTEKERDRHINDKHSSAPAQYKCLYPPCTYASKRESNCKQHMEKAHGWEYVRSKSNGRKKAQTAGSDRAPPTPLTPFLGTPQSATLSTPITPFNPSPPMPVNHDFDFYGFGTPAMPTITFQEDLRRDSINTSDGSALTYSSDHSPIEPTSFNDAVTPEDTTINHADVFNPCTLTTNFNDAFQQTLNTFDYNSFQYTMTGTSDTVPHLSPSGQADMTLFSPQIPMDEGFGDCMDMDMEMNFTRPTEDFTLFNSTGPNDPPMGTTAGFFPDMGPYNGQLDMSSVEPTTTLDDLLNFTTNNHP